MMKMNRIIIIAITLLSLFPTISRAQFFFDIPSVEAYIYDHKEQRSLLLVRSTLEASNKLLHDYSSDANIGYKDINAQLDRYTRAFDVIDILYQTLRTSLNVYDTYHLLWSSDRLEIARDIDTRLTKIYADLVSLEKMMHYKHSIIDILRTIAPYINDEQGRRLTLVEQCRKRWLRHAANSSHSDSYNGKYDDEDE